MSDDQALSTLGPRRWILLVIESVERSFYAKPGTRENVKTTGNTFSMKSSVDLRLTVIVPLLCKFIIYSAAAVQGDQNYIHTTRRP